MKFTKIKRTLFILAAVIFSNIFLNAQTNPRARDLGAPFDGAENSSGDIFIAFSTVNATEASKDEGLSQLAALPNERINPLFWATAQATEEAILNALVAAETMKGFGGNTVYALPHDKLKAALKKYNRLRETKK